jgi:hypothetical protein
VQNNDIHARIIEQEKILRQYADTEEKNVLPARKSFFEKLKGYLKRDDENP